MAHPRRFRFGVELMAPFDGMSWADSVRRVEALGFSTVAVPDHFHQGFGPVTAMAVAVTVTTTLTVAPMVLAVDFRHPAVLARELASIDVLSEGRLEVGLGAGYNPLDYRRSGIAMERPGVRVGRLVEYVRVLKALWASGGEVTFEGEHYRITELDGTPKPHTPGGPPILVAGGGRRILEFAAAEADIVGVNVSTDPGREDDRRPAAIDQKLQWMRAAGDRVEDLELNVWTSVAAVTPDPVAFADRLAARFGGSVDDVLASPLTLIGSSAAQIVERMHERRERWGYSYFTLQSSAIDQFAPIVAAATGT